MFAQSRQKRRAIWIGVLRRSAGNSDIRAARHASTDNSLDEILDFQPQKVSLRNASNHRSERSAISQNFAAQ